MNYHDIVHVYFVQVFPDKAQYPDDKEWEEDWGDGETKSTYYIILPNYF